jgi:geranylgeranyl reductase family protein
VVKTYDVLVVGGGPAGSTTAHRLADAGASVLLVDKARFPRDKPCGGGLTMRAVRQCPVDPSPVVEEKVDLVELRFRYGDAVVRRSREPVILMTQRRRLDAFLLQTACERGVEVREQATVRIDARNNSFLVGRERMVADIIVGADGANGSTAKAVGLGKGIVHGVAYEGNAPYSCLDRARYERRAVVELAGIPGGYGWVFPKAEHANVGVGAWQYAGPQLREHLGRLCDAHGVEVKALDELRGHRLPLRRPGTMIASERALLVGDAAGLIDPVSGDGMYECFVSSRVAAVAILEVLAGRATTVECYQAAVDAELASLHRASWKLKHALDRWPRLSWRLARTQLVWRTVERLLQGELAHPGEQHGLPRLPLRALSLLGR